MKCQDWNWQYIDQCAKNVANFVGYFFNTKAKTSGFITLYVYAMGRDAKKV